MMTREEFETNLIARLEDIKALYKQYNPETFNTPEGAYLSMIIIGDSIGANNRAFLKSETNPDTYRPVDVYISPK